jgi:glycosidase
MRNPIRAFQMFMVCLILLSLISGCNPSKSDIDPTLAIEPTQVLEATVIPEPDISNPLPIRIRLITTSDWTDFKIILGADFVNPNLVFSSSEANTAEVQENHFILDQDLARSETGASVEMVVEGQLTFQQTYKNVLLMIERGDIGMTRVDISRYLSDEWVVIKSFLWDGIKGDGLNSFSVKFPSEELLSQNPVTVEELPPVSPTTTAIITQMGDARPVSPVIGMPVGSDGYPWWNDSVFYEIFVRSFYDSDGDGIGDFNGITQKLDYLNDGNPGTTTDLGVTGIWLMPINPTPSYHGYSVMDYYAVNPEFGSMDDFKTLLLEAQTRGIRVIIDLVLNHTSTENPWFKNASNPSSPYHDWYIWSDYDPGYLGSWGQQVWFPWDGKFFYSTFSTNMPDLNYTNPEVTAEMQNVARYWLEEIGVDGFRLDAAKHLIEEGTQQANSSATHEWYKNFRPYYKQINPEAMIVCEIWDETALTAEYIQGDELDISFEFYLAGKTLEGINAGNADIIKEQLEHSYKLIPALQFATFLTNHDLDRLMNQMGYDLNKARAAAAILLTAPGVPFLYYGEEIGMQGQEIGQLIRSPMQWSTDSYAGFSTVAPWQEVNPGWEIFNVAVQSDHPESLLSHYRTLIHVRNQHAALRVGDLKVVTTENKGVYSILRESQKESVLIVINLMGDLLVDYHLSTSKSNLSEGQIQPKNILGDGNYETLEIDSSGGFSNYQPLTEILPYSVMILQLDDRN